MNPAHPVTKTIVHVASPRTGDKYADGSASHGGFADFCRHDSGNVFNIPEGLSSESAAVMLCAGATVFEPLLESEAVGKRVGIIGLGGLGHLGVLFAKALGAERVVAFSRRGDKQDDALKLGADEYVAVDEAGDWAEQHASSLDLIICSHFRFQDAAEGVFKTAGSERKVLSGGYS